MQPCQKLCTSATRGAASGRSSILAATAPECHQLPGVATSGAVPHHDACQGARARHERARPDPRFRRAVHPADRAPRARERGLLRDPAVHRRARRRSAPSRRRRSSSRAARPRPPRPQRHARPDVVFELGLPILGICYGEQTICAQLGGKVEIGHHREFGRAFIEVVDRCLLFEGLLEPGRAHAGLDEPRRQGGRAAAGLSRGRDLGGLAVRRDRRRRAPDLRRAVPPRGRAYARRRRAAAELHPSGRRLPRRRGAWRAFARARPRGSASRSARRG